MAKICHPQGLWWFARASQPGKCLQTPKRGESEGGAALLIKESSNPTECKKHKRIQEHAYLSVNLIFGYKTVDQPKISQASLSPKVPLVAFFFLWFLSFCCLKNILTQNVKWLWSFPGCIREDCSMATKCAAAVCFSLQCTLRRTSCPVMKSGGIVKKEVTCSLAMSVCDI